jgi:hydrogenase nickel incorporation protein HypA/HybF
MHEALVAQSLLDAVLDEAAKHNATPVRVKISCGGLHAVNEEVLGFSFEAIAKGTVCEGLALQVEHKPLHAHCRSCDQDFEVEFAQPQCPQCAGEDFELLADAPLLLEEIEFQTD